MSEGAAAAKRRPRRAALPLDSSVFFKLVRVVNLTARPFSESIGKAHRLSLNEWRVLLVLASHSGVEPSRLDTFGLAPAFNRRSTIALSERNTAQCSAVAPSA